MPVNIKKIISDQESKNFQHLIERETGQAVQIEHRFFPTRQWKFDFAIEQFKIAIEIEGGSFKERTYTSKKTGNLITTIGGRHNSGKGFLGDIEKYNKATELGWVLLRYTPQQKYIPETIEQIRNVLILRKNDFRLK